MIKNTFLFLPGISKRKEENIHSQGIKTWNDFLKADKIKGISKKSKISHDRMIREARHNLLMNNASFFTELIPSSEHWRLYDHFKDEALFLDIESDGKKITVIGFFDGYETKTLVNNADRDAVKEMFSSRNLIVTFNGKAFDIPVIEKYFNMKITLPHVDLVHVCRRCGLKGGLKNIEKTLGIRRNSILRHVRGQDAAELWRCYHATGDEDFLQMLIAYNEEDCISLKRIADTTTKMLEEACFQ